MSEAAQIANNPNLVAQNFKVKVVHKVIFVGMMKHLTSMWMNETSKIWMKNELFIQEWAIPSLNFVVIQRFHPLKKEESIAKYSLKTFLSRFWAKYRQKENVEFNP
jgi:hypothetical protein